jgi:hypothetical protein
VIILEMVSQRPERRDNLMIMPCRGLPTLCRLLLFKLLECMRVSVGHPCWVAARFSLGIGVKIGGDIVAAAFARKEDRKYFFVLGERSIQPPPSHSHTLVCM